MDSAALPAAQANTFTVDRTSNADMMKNIQKARLQRKAMVDPGFAGELVKLQSTGVYNAKGDVVQAVSASLGQA
ncbi:MAG: hypothetical protein AB7D51_05485 [Desulfovibrionaceae bacterium]|jgi:hypothetical protein